MHLTTNASLYTFELMMNEKCVPVCAKQTNVVTQTCYLFFNELG